MVQSVSGDRVHETPVTGDPPFHKLSLRFGRNRFDVLRQDPPWKVMRAFSLPDGGKLVHLNNASGGVLAGDRLSLDAELLPGTTGQVTTTGATRLYRHRSGAADSEQRTTFALGEAAQLEYLPDPLIPYAGSRHTQRTEIRMARGAALFWWETLAPGRLAAGERFGFERLRVETKIFAGGRPVLLEDFVLEPARKDLASPVRMLGYTHMASFYAVQEGRRPEFWRNVEEQMTEIARRRSAPGRAVWGASMLASDGILVRGLATSGRLTSGPLVEFWSAARLAVTGSEASPPRKTY